MSGKMFEYYERLCAAAIDETQLRREWGCLFSKMVRPTGRDDLGSVEQLEGHIANPAACDAWNEAPTLFAHRGIYIFGAWKGGEARIQYIGIADGQTMFDRFAGRNARYRSELRNARTHRDLFCNDDHFAEAFAYSKRLPLERWRSRDINVRASRPTRPSRFERYAKIGLENLWFFLIPAPGTPEPRKSNGQRNIDYTMRGVETALIQLASADLFRSFSGANRPPMAFPLLNRESVLPNRFIPDGSDEYLSFKHWLDSGPWWHEMDAYVRSRRLT